MSKAAVKRALELTHPELVEELVTLGAVTKTGMDFARIFKGDDLASDEAVAKFEAYGRYVGGVHRAAKWWLADWLNFGEGAFGHRFEQALDSTGLSEGYLRNIMSVGASVTPSRRRPGVAFSLHETVAGLPGDAQTHWLNEAIEKGYTQRELRRAIKAHYNGGVTDDDEEDSDSRHDTTKPLSPTLIIEKANLVASWATKDGDCYRVPAEAFVQLLAAIGRGE